MQGRTMCPSWADTWVCPYIAAVLYLFCLRNLRMSVVSRSQTLAGNTCIPAHTRMQRNAELVPVELAFGRS